MARASPACFKNNLELVEGNSASLEASQPLATPLLPLRPVSRANWMTTINHEVLCTPSFSVSFLIKCTSEGFCFGIVHLYHLSQKISTSSSSVTGHGIEASVVPFWKRLWTHKAGVLYGTYEMSPLSPFTQRAMFSLFFF